MNIHDEIDRPNFIWRFKSRMDLINRARVTGVAWWNLYKLLPDEFARVILSGQPDARKIELVTYQILKVCRGFINNKSAIKLHSYLNDLAIPLDAEKINRSKPKLIKHVKNLQKLLNQQEEMLQKILAMKYLVSLALGIPPRRLCDYIFQYSPTIHINRLQKLIENWEEILSYHQYLPGGNSEDTAITNRLLALRDQNIQISVEFKRRMNYQIQFLKFKDLHPVILSFISANSTSGSLLKYADALSQVAEEYSLIMGQRPEINSPAYLICCAKLRFLYYKQRAHPGFDLNVHLFNLCSTQVNSHASNDWKVLETILSKLPKHGPHQHPLSMEPNQIKLEIAALCKLSAMVRKVIVDNRNVIVEQFTNYCRTFFGTESFRNTFILTHGHSKTVREVLKRGLQPLGPNFPNVFVLEPDDVDDFETRLMLHELREDDEFRFLRNASSTKVEFMKLLGNQAKVMLVLGAECFDSDLRVLHPLGISQSIKSLQECLGSQFQVVVVGEEYKHYLHLMSFPEFYRNHLDRVEILNSDLVDYIITNKSIYQKNLVPIFSNCCS